MNFVVGVVLYNCQIDKIKQIMEEYHNLAQKIILVDNGSNNIINIERLLEKETTCVLIKNKYNKGIAYALNQILEKSFNIHTNYLLTLDQDSFLKYDDLKHMLKYMNDSVAMVCPEIIDVNKMKNKLITNECEPVSRCITSGSVMNLQVCKNIGKFDEKMFIDYVDFDYCKRIQLTGYKILKIKDCFLKHEIGKRTIKRFFGIYVYPTNHSSFRVYYYFRNMHYYYLKYKERMTFKEKINEIIRICWKYVSIILYEDDKKNKIKSAKRGYNEAKKMLD